MSRDSDIQEQSRSFLRSLSKTLREASSPEITGPDWETVRDNLAAISRANALDGVTATQTATGVFALKQPIFKKLNEELKNNPGEAAQHDLDPHYPDRQARACTPPRSIKRAAKR